MSDRHNIFGEPGRRSPQTEQRPRVPLVQMRNEDGGGRGQRPPTGRKPRKYRLLLAIVADVLIAALILLIFYITNYEMGTEQQGVDLPMPSTITNTPTPTPTGPATVNSASPGPSGSVKPTTVDPNNWRAKFADKFTTGEAVQTDTSYKSANVNVKVDKVQKDGVTYFVVDIYVAELKYLKTAFAVNADKMGAVEHTEKIGNENNAIVAINGDSCTGNRGIVVRNGKWYDNGAKESDQLVLNYDGTMQTYTANELDADKIQKEGAWQVWTFGPMLLKDGKPMTEFNSTLTVANPRTAIGYYEPGHYCFVVVDGRQPGYSTGYSCAEMSQLFSSLGCKVAFNLDGGHSSEMAFNGKVINKPQEGGRPISDIIYIPKE